MKRAAFLMIAILSLLGCEKAKKQAVDPRLQYEAQTSPASVLHNLQASYLRHDPVGYSRLLADDFRFYFDEGTRQQNSNLPVFWTRAQDTLQTKALFESPEVSDIRIQLQFGEPRPAQEPGRTTWVFIDVLDTFLQVDLAPKPGELEGLTLRVDGQQQRFYFRKGRTPEDTGSETWYLVEWKDFGFFGFSVKSGLRDRLLVEGTTWSGIKALFQ